MQRSSNVYFSTFPGRSLGPCVGRLGGAASTSGSSLGFLGDKLLLVKRTSSGQRLADLLPSPRHSAAPDPLPPARLVQTEGRGAWLEFGLRLLVAPQGLWEQTQQLTAGPPAPHALFPRRVPSRMTGAQAASVVPAGGGGKAQRTQELGGRSRCRPCRALGHGLLSRHTWQWLRDCCVLVPGGDGGAECQHLSRWEGDGCKTQVNTWDPQGQRREGERARRRGKGRPWPLCFGHGAPHVSTLRTCAWEPALHPGGQAVSISKSAELKSGVRQTSSLKAGGEGEKQPNKTGKKKVLADQKSQ